jgi:hypothetical protein
MARRAGEDALNRGFSSTTIRSIQLPSSWEWSKRPFPSQGIYEFTRMRVQEIERAYRPQPTEPNWAIGCLEWQAEQEKAGLNSGT